MRWAKPIFLLTSLHKVVVLDVYLTRYRWTDVSSCCKAAMREGSSVIVSILIFDDVLGSFNDAPFHRKHVGLLIFRKRLVTGSADHSTTRSTKWHCSRIMAGQGKDQHS